MFYLCCILCTFIHFHDSSQYLICINTVRFIEHKIHSSAFPYIIFRYLHETIGPGSECFSYTCVFVLACQQYTSICQCVYAL